MLGPQPLAISKLILKFKILPWWRGSTTPSATTSSETTPVPSTASASKATLITSPSSRATSVIFKCFHFEKKNSMIFSKYFGRLILNFFILGTAVLLAQQLYNKTVRQSMAKLQKMHCF
jgi:hypothetical protein